MTVITLTVPHPPDAQTLQRVAQELKATDVSVRETALATPATAASRPLLPLPPLVVRSAEEQAQAWEILVQGGDAASIAAMICWHEEDREDRPLPGRA